MKAAAKESGFEILRRAFRPGMSPWQIVRWMMVAAVGIAIWSVGFLVCVGLATELSPAVGAAAWLGGSVLVLAIPGVGVLQPGGARGPVILRALPAFWLITCGVSTLAYVAYIGARVDGVAEAPGDSWVGGLLVLPFVATPLAWAVLIGRSTSRSALLGGLSVLLALTTVTVGVMARGITAWFVVALALTVSALAVLARAALRRTSFSAEDWVEAHAGSGALFFGDQVWPMPDALVGHEGAVSLPRAALPARAPGRGASPPDPEALFACKLAQVPWILRDVLDAKLALALFLSTSGAMAMLAQVMRD